jgi:hypothetical protein
MSKSAWIAALVCLNVVLLVALFVATSRVPAAFAQGTGLSGNYLAVAGEVQDQYDALYILDVRQRTLHAFMWDKTRRRLEYCDWRDLDRDFRHNRE